MNTPRIPGFAICARCGARPMLAPCPRCGMLFCRECRGAAACIVCYREELRAAARTVQRRRWQRLGQRAGVAACVAATTVAGVGAAVMPDLPVPLEEPHAQVVARGQVRFVGNAVERYWQSNGALCPSSLGELRRGGYLMAPPVDPWGEPLLYGCTESPRAFVVLSKGPDRQAGTADDVVFATP